MKKYMVYHKLVRDRIPEIIEASGRKCITQMLPDDAYIQALDAKLNEEPSEYQQRKSLEELATCWKLWALSSKPEASHGMT